MGTHCSSELHRGHIQVKKTTTMKLLLLTALAAVALAEPEADAHYGYYGYGYHPGFYGYGLWGHQQAWPTASAPGVSSTCFGCRGKRSAEADAEAEPGYGFYGYYPYGYYGLHRGYYGLPLGAGVLVTPVPLLLTPTEASKALARGLLKRMLLLPKLKLHLLLQLLPFIMDYLSTDMVFPLFTTTPPSNGPDIRSPDSKELPGALVEKGPLRLMLNPVITDTPMVTTDILITDTVPVTTFTEAPKALASKCNVAHPELLLINVLIILQKQKQTSD